MEHRICGRIVAEAKDEAEMVHNLTGLGDQIRVALEHPPAEELDRWL